MATIGNVKYTHFGTDPEPCALSIGSFDGVHRGHQSLLNTLIQQAALSHSISSVLTFDPTPAEYFARQRNIDPPARLLTTADRVTKLLEYGANSVRVIDFTEHVQAMSAPDFFDAVIRDVCQAQVLVLGSDFRFGAHRAGDMTMLAQLCEAEHCGLISVPLLHKEGLKIGSSGIRTLLQKNRVREANAALGYTYSVPGVVIHGEGRGNTIGFPTANMLPDIPIPLRGVFATQVQLEDGQIYNSVTNIGTKPTFDNSTLSCETHILDFDNAIYDQHIRVYFVDAIRPEQGFDSVDNLIKQITQDIMTARNVFETP